MEPETSPLSPENTPQSKDPNTIYASAHFTKLALIGLLLLLLTLATTLIYIKKRTTIEPINTAPTMTPTEPSISYSEDAPPYTTPKTELHYGNFVHFANSTNTHEALIRNIQYYTPGGTTKIECELRILPINIDNPETTASLDDFSCNIASDGFGAYYANFPNNWINENEFVIEKSPGVFVAYHIQGSSRTVLQYKFDEHTHDLENANESGSLWLLSHSLVDDLDHLQGINLLLINSTGTTIKEFPLLQTTEEFGYGFIYPTYRDPVNKGFFVLLWSFGEIKEDEENAILSKYTAFFIDEETQSLRKISTSEPAFGLLDPSCEFYQDARTTSEPGKIVIHNTNCLSLPKEVKSQPFTISLN